MIKTLKNSLKRFRQWTSPVRHPLREIQRTIENSLRSMLAQIGQGISPPCSGSAVPQAQTEASLLMDHFVREFVRLQRQIEGLQDAVERLESERAGSEFAAGIDETLALSRTANRRIAA